MRTLLLFWSGFFLFLFLLWLLKLGLSELCWLIVGKVVILVLFLILGQRFWFFTIEINVCCRLIIYGLYYVEVGSFYAHFLKSFNHKWVLNFVKVFFCIYWDYQFSCSVISDSLWPHRLQHARLPCPSPTPEAYSNSCPLSRWCHPTISSSVVPFSSHLQSFPASGSFQMSQFSASGSQSIGVSASTSVLPVNIQDYFPLDGPVGSP